MKMTGQRISVNEKEAWGMLLYDNDFDACIGARFADNRRREFGIFGDRITMVGEDRVVSALKKWLFGKKTINAIKRNTSFAYGINDRNCWATSETIACKGYEIQVTLSVKCQGEYAYVSAYASKIPDSRVWVDLVHQKNDAGEYGFQIRISGRAGDFPVIWAKNKLEATNILLDYISNGLEGKEDMRKCPF